MAQRFILNEVSEDDATETMETEAVQTSTPETEESLGMQ